MIKGMKGTRTVLSAFFVFFFCFQQVTFSDDNKPKLKPEDVPQSFTGEVLKVVDGDTINIKALGYNKLSVRFLNIDTPECHFQDKDKEIVKQEYCEESMQFVADRVPIGSTVTIKTDVEPLDKYGRILGHIFVGNKDINLELLKAGWAALYVIYPNVDSLEEYAIGAKYAFENKLGIFNKNKPIDLLPFEFRLNASGREPDKWTGNITSKLFYRPLNYKTIEYYNRLFFFKFKQAEEAGYVYKERFLFEFDNPALVNNDGFTTVTFKDTLLLNRGGYPSLPFKKINVLVPYGKEIDTFQFKSNQLKKINGEFTILPGAYNIPIGQEGERKKYRIDDNVYNIDENIPQSLYSNESIQKLHGYTFLSANIFPLKYNPKNKSLLYYKQILLEISFRDKLPDFHSSLRFDTERVEKILSNEDLLWSYPEYLKSITIKRSSDSENNTPVNTPEEKKKEKVGYLIVTSKKLESTPSFYNFQKLIDYLTTKDLVCEIATVEDVYNSYNGRDKAEKIRNFIIDKYKKSGVRYVLLGGDADVGNEIIPVRKLHAEFKWDNLAFSEEISSDFYYSALDGNFNHNNNEYFGESTDGFEGEEIDLYPEIFIGRAPVDNEEELSNFIEKTIYAHENKTRRGLFVSEKIYKNSDGASYMEEINRGSNSFGISTVGYPVSWDKSFLYEKNKKWNVSDIASDLNNGVFMVNHIGISSKNENMKLVNDSLGNLTNKQPFFLYTQGNNSGNFTARDSIVEDLLNMKSGAFAVVANSSFGIAPEDPDSDESVITRGASQYFHRQFTNSIFGSQNKRIGEANQISKEQNVPWMDEGTFRWVFFGLNLLGDPYVKIE